MNDEREVMNDERKRAVTESVHRSSFILPRSFHVFVSGYPGDVGGANTECWHTVRLWRQFGLDVTFIPTWKAPDRWRQRLDAIGCRTIESAPERLADVPGLPGSVVVSFCNSNFLAAADRFRDLGCRIVWVGCMNWLFAEERRLYRRRGPFDRYVFQSRYQLQTLMGTVDREAWNEERGALRARRPTPHAPRSTLDAPSSTPHDAPLASVGVTPEQCHLIRGAFFWDEFPFRPTPHRPGTPLVIGRISRAAEDKYSSNTWPIYGRIPHPVLARLMAWDRRVQRKLGPPPEWAQCLPAGTETPQDFLAKLHGMVQVNGGARENWPRSGLEAMATGVPVVVQNQWGWREMVRHGQTGYLCDNDDQLVFYTARLAYDEDLRMEMACQARKALQEELANPEVIWAGWQGLLEPLGVTR